MLAIHATGFDEDGIRVILPTDPVFDELARPLIGRVADIGLKLKPMLLIVSNESTRTVVSFSKTWVVRHRGGRTTTSRSHTSFPEFVCGDGSVNGSAEALPPGGRRVEAEKLVIQGYAEDEPYYDQFLPQFVIEKDRMLADSEELRMDVDAVIFADGTLIGNDQDAWLSGLFAEYVAAKKEWYRGILQHLDAGGSVDDAYAPIRAFQEARRRRMHDRQSFRREDLQLWKTQAAAEASRWRRHFSDEELPAALRQSIRLEPFIIHRR